MIGVMVPELKVVSVKESRLPSAFTRIPSAPAWVKPAFAKCSRAFTGSNGRARRSGLVNLPKPAKVLCMRVLSPRKSTSMTFWKFIA